MLVHVVKPGCREQAGAACSMPAMVRVRGLIASGKRGPRQQLLHWDNHRLQPQSRI